MPAAPVRPPGFVRWGGLTALALPAVGVAVATALLAWWGCSGTACVRPAGLAWSAVLVAVPTAIPLGLPWFVNPVNLTAAAATSALVWFWLGRLAARRAARGRGTWRAYWGELAWMAGGLGAGLALGLGAIALWLRV